MVEQIVAKRDGEELSSDALAWMIAEYTADRIPDYQMSAFLMAVIFNGMSPAELEPWTEAMLHSGDVLDLSDVSKRKIDKHSTGGVGDKISIPLAPIVASCGIAVPMMSGRGLGHTGGTLDKLEAIPGFTTQISPDAFANQLNEIGVVMAGQSERLVPADKRLYALRDATGTVPSMPLIASSIMSKKLAENLDGLLLNVTVGSGAQMKTLPDAMELSEMMVGVGRSHNTPTIVLLTNMDQPVGRAVGNANEVAESVAVLKGVGPEDVTHLTTLFATEMLMLAGTNDRTDAAATVQKAIDTGAAYETLLMLVERQGGDPAAIDDPTMLPGAPHTHVITADRDGYVTKVNAYDIGTAAVRLGAGRQTKKSIIDPGVGFSVEVKIGEEVTKGQPLTVVSYRSSASLESALSVLKNTFGISEEPVATPDLILGEVR